MNLVNLVYGWGNRVLRSPKPPLSLSIDDPTPDECEQCARMTHALAEADRFAEKLNDRLTVVLAENVKLWRQLRESPVRCRECGGVQPWGMAHYCGVSNG